MTQTSGQAYTPPTIDSARTGEDLLDALYRVPVEWRETALGARRGTEWTRILRSAADLCGEAYADTMTARQATRAILASF